MLEGLSTNRRCETSATCLVAAGQHFVIRYHSARTTQSEKRLHPREAAELARAGLFIASVYQDRARKLEDFGAARGAEDAAAALIYAGQVGQPAGSAVYFAVDEDFSAAQIQAAVVVGGGCRLAWKTRCGESSGGGDLEFAAQLR